MLRLRFEKRGEAVWISHLDLMRLFQRAFQRAGLTLTHTQGFNPRPSVSIALPLSVGVESRCELLDFALMGEPIACEKIRERLNRALVSGVTVTDVYEGGQKLRHLALLHSTVTLEYDGGVPENGVQQLKALFARESLIVEKKGKNGVTQQDIIPMLRRLHITQTDANTVTLDVLACCQNPTLNPAQLTAAVETYLPALSPSFARYCRNEIYDTEETVFR